MYKIKVVVLEVSETRDGHTILELNTESRANARAMVLIGKENSNTIAVGVEKLATHDVKFKGVD